MNGGHLDPNETEVCFHPTWLDSRRDFHDRRTIEAETFNEVLTRHVHPFVQTWTCDEQGWQFESEDFTVIVGNDVAGNLSVHAVSDVVPRKYLDPMRVKLREILFARDELSWSPGDFVGTLLQVVEEAVAWSELWHQSQQANPVSERHAKSRYMSTVLKDFKTYSDNGSGRRGFDARASRSYESVLNSSYGGKPMVLALVAPQMCSNPS